MKKFDLEKYPTDTLQDFMDGFWKQGFLPTEITYVEVLGKAGNKRYSKRLNKIKFKEDLI